MLYLTYDIEEKKDGLGAQYQRVLGIIALSKILNCEYVHTPIQSLEHSVSAKKAEKFFNIGKIYKDVNEIEYDQKITTAYPTENQLLELKSANLNTLVKIFFPYEIIEGWNDDKNYLEIYDKEVMPSLRPVLSYRETMFDKRNLNIAIHVRRGDVSKETYPKRFVDTEFYRKLIIKLKKIYYGRNPSIYIFTQIDENNQDEFDGFEEANICANQDVFMSFYHMAKADVLVTAPSSFSMLAALYNASKVFYIEKTLFNNKKHKKINRWELIEIESF